MRRGFSNLKQTIFSSDFLNNRGIVRLLSILLLIMVIYGFTQIAYLFRPLAVFLQFFALPFIGTGISYYLFSPLVIRLERRGVTRNISIWSIFIGVTLLIIWGIATLVPIVQFQTQSFIDNLPEYSQAIEDLFNQVPIVPDLQETFPNFAAYLERIDFSNMFAQFQPLITSTFGGLGNVIGTITAAVAGLITIPVLLYYLLLEDYKLFPNILYHIPDKYRETTKAIFYQSHHQIGRYIRGQVTVAIIVGVMFAIGYNIIGLDYAITLGVLATILNVIPYIGSFLAAIPAFIIGLITSPFMLLKVLIVLGIENLIEARLIQPQILGSNMKIHPVTILIVLLGAGRLFGLTGVIIAVPTYAVVKVIFTELYRIFRRNSNLYEDDEIYPKPLDSSLVQKKINEKAEADKRSELFANDEVNTKLIDEEDERESDIKRDR